MSIHSRENGTSGSSPGEKLTARARALKLDRPRYTASAPFSTAALSWGQPPAGASTCGFLRVFGPVAALCLLE